MFCKICSLFENSMDNEIWNRFKLTIFRVLVKIVTASANLLGYIYMYTYAAYRGRKNHRGKYKFRLASVTN